MEAIVKEVTRRAEFGTFGVNVQTPSVNLTLKCVKHWRTMVQVGEKQGSTRYDLYKCTEPSCDVVVEVEVN